MQSKTRFCHVHRGWLLALVLTAYVCTSAATAAAATITVTTTADQLSDDGHCSLREAVTAANTDGAVFLGAGECPPGNGADTIVLPAGRFTLSIPRQADNDNATGDLDISKTLALVGAGAPATIIDANHIDRAIHNQPGATVTIQGVTITGGQADGGADGASATGANGSGAGSPGKSATGADATDGQGGGGIWNEGNLSILDSVISGNAAGAGGTGGNGSGGSGASSVDGAGGGNGSGGAGGPGGDGGGILSSSHMSPGASLRITRTVVTGNSAGAGGAGGTGRGGAGGSAGTGTAGTGGAGIGGGGGTGGSGGGIAQEGLGSVTVAQSTITGNTGGASGTPGSGLGGLGARSAGDAGGAGGIGFGGGASAGGPAGAIFAEGALTLQDDLIAGNAGGEAAAGGRGAGGAGGDDAPSAGEAGAGGQGHGGSGGSGGSPGAIWAGTAASPGGTVVATNDTFANNSAGAGGAGGHGDGGHGGSAGASGTGGDGGNGAGGSGGGGGFVGGLSVGAGMFVHTTITSNRVGIGGSPGPAIPGAPGTGGTLGTAGTAALGGPGAPGGVGAMIVMPPTTLQSSIVANNDGPSCSDFITDGGHNISFPDPTCTGATVDPRLGPLADNGGPTQTQALEPGSPALDAVPSTGAGCPATDQRGVARPQGAGCDIGAYEHAPPGASTAAATGISATGATLGGQVNPEAQATSYHFEYGPTTSYGSSTVPQHTGADLTPAPVSGAVSGLAPAMTYHYRLVASNADGTAAGIDQTFTTSRGGVVGASGVPRFLSASVRPSVFAVQGAGRAGRHARRHPPIGTTLHYALSEAARVVFTIEQVLPGRRVGRACLVQTARNGKHRACVRLGKPRRFAANGAAGVNVTPFTGRIGGMALAPGHYRVTLIGTDAAGARSAPKRLTFRVVPR